MKIHRNLNNITPVQNAVLTIGTFDGVHKGHQKIIERLKQHANQIGGESAILTFHPHPRFLVNPNDSSLKLLNTLEEKIELLERYGVDHVVVVPFTREFSQQSAQDYIEHFLYGSFHPSVVVIGYDHRFGNNRQGDIELLKAYGVRLGFEVEEISRQDVDDIAVSSTKIRQALEAGDVSTAEHLMGHSFSLQGIIVKGRQLGRTIGFPTANIMLNDQAKSVPADGVYAVRVKVGDEWLKGMMNVGNKPTFDGLQRTMEVNIFEFSRDIYGEVIKVEFIERIREEKKFNGVDALKSQLETDRETVLKIFSGRNK